MIRTDFSNSGLKVGENSDNLTYAYGLGDFFSLMFEDTAVPNLLLECDTLTASEVYSRFLQLTSTLSLEDIQTTIGSQIKLALITSSDLVEGTLSTYRLPVSVVSSRYVANRPLLPTELLENKVDFDIYQGDDGSSYIRFAKALSEHSGYAFSNRVLSDGTTQYAIWLVDAHVDERLVSYFFGNLLKVGTNNSSEAFANFVYGLYYVYTQGPTLTVLKRGLNLVLGIPLARLEETVIDIRMYLQTDQYIVLTDQNQYIIPYGLPPSVAVGDTLSVGQELAEWIEVKDYENDGEWWTNLYVPTTLIPEPPSGYSSRYATSGSTMDFIMRKYLKTHTFLVRVNVTTFKNLQTFSELISVIRQSKPSYTQPIYVWAVGNDESAVVSDTDSDITINSNQEYDIGSPYDHMKRSSRMPLSRNTARFIRFNGPNFMTGVLGENESLNSSNSNVQFTPISGYSNIQAVLRGNSWEELDWISVMANRASDTWRGRRDTIGYRRGNLISDSSIVRPDFNADYSDEKWSSQTQDFIDSRTLASVSPVFQETLLRDCVTLSSVEHGIPEGSRIVPLAVLSNEELILKLGLFGLEKPSNWRFMLPVYSDTFAINTEVIHSQIKRQNRYGALPSSNTPSPLEVVQFFGVRDYAIAKEDTLTSTILAAAQNLDKSMCKFMLYQGGASLTYAAENDILLFSGIDCRLTAVYLVTADSQSRMPSFLPVSSITDSLSAKISGLTNRGLALHGSPVYFRRGSLSFARGDSFEALEEPSTELANFLQSSGVRELSHVVPLTVVRGREAEDKSTLWGDDIDPSAKYRLVSHPYPYRKAAEKALKKYNTFFALSPSLNMLYQDSYGLVPVTGMEQPVGLMQDRYGFGASASQPVASCRPVVSARYNRLTFTSFEGTVPSSTPGQVGTPPLGWSVVGSVSGGYIKQYRNSAIQVETSSAYVVLGRSVPVPARISSTFSIKVPANRSSLALREIIGVTVIAGTITVAYKVDGVAVDQALYAPSNGAVITAVISNSGPSEGSVSLRIGVGVYSSTVGGTVTGLVELSQPDYRYSTYQKNLPAYQRVGNPVEGTSLVSGVDDYDRVGFPPYLRFDGIDDYLVAYAPNSTGSGKLSVSMNFSKLEGSSETPVLEVWSPKDSLDVTAQDQLAEIARVNSLSTDLLSLTTRFRISASGSGVTSVIEGIHNQKLGFSYSNSSTPVSKTLSASVDTTETSWSRQMRLYQEDISDNSAPVYADTLSTISMSDSRLIIGSSIGSGLFFKGDIYGVCLVNDLISVGDRSDILAWISNDWLGYSTKPNAKLWGYPDFFRRDSEFPTKLNTEFTSVYEYMPDSSEVDLDWGEDRILMYRLDRESVGLYWVTRRDTLEAQEYWTTSYSGVPSLRHTAIMSTDTTAVPPFKETANLNYEYLRHAVNTESLDAIVRPDGAVFAYTDSWNIDVPISRTGTSLTQPLLIE